MQKIWAEVNKSSSASYSDGFPHKPLSPHQYRNIAPSSEIIWRVANVWQYRSRTRFAIILSEVKFRQNRCLPQGSSDWWHILLIYSEHVSPVISNTHTRCSNDPADIPKKSKDPTTSPVRRRKKETQVGDGGLKSYLFPEQPNLEDEVSLRGEGL